MQILAYSFSHAREFIDVTRGQLDASDWSELTLILSDRTAQREFAADVNADGASPLLDPPLALLARQLQPLAPLGGPGTGLVGVGPVLGSLHRLGLGSDKDLSECLAGCGVTGEIVETITSNLRDGGLLAFVTEEHQRELLATRGQAVAFELPNTTHPANAPVIAPAAPVSEQRATYTPVFTPTDVTDRNR